MPRTEAISANGLVFVSGQLALRPEHAEIVGEGIGSRRSRCSQTCGAILEEAGSGLDRLVKTTVYLTDLGDFAGMNKVYARHVGDTPPARATIEISALPSGAKVEIEVIALARSARTPGPAAE